MSDLLSAYLYVDGDAKKTENDLEQARLRHVGEQAAIENDQLRAKIRHQDALNAIPKGRSLTDEHLEQELEQLREYKGLLSLSMSEIAERSGEFRPTYERQQEVLASWILSQNSFKALALKYGEKLGMSKTEMNKDLSETRLIVLEELAINDELVKRFKEKLLLDLKA